MEQESCNDTIKTVDSLSSLTDTADVAIFKNIEAALHRQIQADVDSLTSIYNRQNELLPKVNEYRDLHAEAKPKEDRMRRAAGLFGDRLTNDKRYEKTSTVPLHPEEWRKSMALWEAIQAILEHVPEMQIVELHDTLREFGFKTTRAGVESAISYHKEIFTTQSRGREKFVSLKQV